MQNLLALPRHEGSLTIEHNPHKDNYETAKEYLEDDIAGPGKDDFATDEQCQRAIDTNELWTVHWYPDTPVGFYEVVAPTLEEALEFARTAEKG